MAVIRTLFASVSLLGFAAGSAVATPPARPAPASPASIHVYDGVRRMDVNRINMLETNFGSSAFDFEGVGAGLEFPRGSHRTAIFAAGLWLGARIAGETRVTVAEYSSEFQPGRMIAGAPDNLNRPEYKVYKVWRWTGSASDTSHVERSSSDAAADPLVHQSWSEYMSGAVPYGAPWRLHRLPNTSTPNPFDSVDVAGPDVRGDQMTWCVFNDADVNGHNASPGSTPPLGAEVQRTLYAYDQDASLGNVVFFAHRIINRSTQTWDSLYVSEWLDPDLGEFADDLVMCDTVLSLGACYNADEHDNIYGNAVPALGCVLLGARVGANGSVQRMTSFARYINGTDPQNADESYNYLSGANADGTPVVDPTTGQVTRYALSGNPVTGSGWLDSGPSDRRMTVTSGPFHASPGDTLQFDFALIALDCGRRLHAVAELQYEAAFVRQIYAGTSPTIGLPNFVASVDTASVFASGCDDNPVGFAIHNTGGATTSSFQNTLEQTGTGHSRETLLDLTLPGMLPGDSYARTVQLSPDFHNGTGRVLLNANVTYSVVESTHSDDFADLRYAILAPLIKSLTDVGADQGRQLRLRVGPAAPDAAGSATPITQYEVYRRNTSALTQAANPALQLQRLRAARRAGMQSAANLLTADWDYLGAMPAHASSEYGEIVPTLVDSAQGGGWSVFLVRAATAVPTTYFDSCPDSARSVDNLPPGAPRNLRVLVSGPSWVALAWDPPGDPDVQAYHVYRGANVGFVPGPSNLVASLASLALVDSAAGANGANPIYKVSALDAQGNEGQVALLGAFVTAVNGAALPRELALRLSGRNPVRGGAEFAVELPARSSVSLTLYDLQGRAVRHAWSRGVRAAGRYSWSWSLRDDDGRAVSAGIYFARLECNGQTKVTRAVVAE